MTQSDFDTLIKELKDKGYHLWYGEDWCWVSYKDYRVKLTLGMTFMEAGVKLLKFKPIYPNKTA